MSVGRFLRPPHGTIPAAVITNENKMLRSFKNKEIFISKAEDGPYEPNNQLNVCTTSVTEVEVAGVKLVQAPSNSLLTVPRRWL